jgi:hypothetical protein
MNLKPWSFAFVLVILTASVAVAQLPQGQMPGLDAAMAKLFGKNNAFTATATARLVDEKQNETMSMPMSYALLDTKIRTEIDMTQVKSKEMPAEAGDMIKKMGMDKMVSIVRPDKKMVFIAYPTLRAYAEQPLEKAEATTAQDVKIDSTKLGAETIDGHPCVKNKVTVSAPGAEKQEAIVWNASDLKDFPIRIQTQQPNGGSLTMTYSNIKLEKPDAKLFEPPADYEKHTNVQALVQSAMMKMLAK